jgi:hypothetical protein
MYFKGECHCNNVPCFVDLFGYLSKSKMWSDNYMGKLIDIIRIRF